MKPGDEVLHYRIVRQLGAGGMGVVYEAIDTRLGRHVALKLLADKLRWSPEIVERFEREAKIASSLNHPNICTVYDIGIHDDRKFIVMELLEGETLRERLHGQPLPVELVLDVGHQLADALDAAHAKGIVHRDVKPANILINRRGQAKLLDFGVAKLGTDAHAPAAETRPGGDVLTSAGTAVGSINYMSPEQARGEELDGRTDLFSLGLVLYEMTTGRPAFAGPTTAVVFDAILNRPPVDPRQLNDLAPDDLQRVILRSLEKDRRLRFQTAADMLAELDRIRRDAGVRASLASGATATATASAKTTTAVTPIEVKRMIPIGILALIGVAASAWFLWPRSTPPPALGAKDTVLVADFTNTTGDPVFDDALKQAVSVQLQQTPFVTLLPDSRVQRTLTMMQRSADEPVRGQVAREVCQRAGAKATVEGSIAALGTSFVLNLGVHNCETGAPLAQQQAQAASKEEVLKTLGGAVTEIRRHLGESLASIEKYDVPALDATTKSLEALRMYGLAIRTRVTKGDEAAIPFFQKAVEIDPDFGLAHAKLGVVLTNRGRTEEGRAAAAKAYEYKDRVSEYERLYIVWNHATRVLQDQKLALSSLELMTASYPRDWAARNNLGVYYVGQRDFKKAYEHFQQAVDIAPDEPQPLSNAAQMLLFLDRRDEAYALADRVFAIRSDGGLATTCWISAVRAGDPRADAFEQRAMTMATPQQIAATRSAIALWRGRLQDYYRLQDEQRTAARAAGDQGLLASLDLSEHFTRAAYEGGAGPAGLRTWAQGAGVPPPLKAQATVMLGMLGDVDGSRKILPALEQEGRKNQQIWVPATIGRAYVQGADGRAADGVATLERVLVEIPQAVDLNFHIGRLREIAGDPAGAIAAYRATIAAIPTLGLSPVVARCRLSLAEALLEQGDRAGANEQLDALLAQWKSADTEFALLKTARALRAR
jgi:tetratricopeptide (TPR) repeat protein/tRNA A-37 threonylcarbamoyl transferase component Bud32